MKASNTKIKKAFEETLDRWEKITKDTDYFRESRCHLCLLENEGFTHHSCNDSCPIRHVDVFSDHYGCSDTPFGAFYNVRTVLNAETELCFLRKVYIWWVRETFGSECCKDESKISSGIKEEIDGLLEEIENVVFRGNPTDEQRDARGRHAVARLLFCHLPCGVCDEVEKGNFVTNYNKEN